MSDDPYAALVPQGGGNDPYAALVPAKPGIIERAKEAVFGKPLTLSDLITGQDKKPRPSAAGAAVRHAGREAIPTLGGAAGFGAGFATGGTLTAPAEAIPVVGPAINAAGAIGGGLLGAMGMGYVLDKAQSAILDALPVSVQRAIGQDQETRQADEAQHPIASFAGSLAPSILTMRPGRTIQAAEDASRLVKALSHPVTSRVIGGTLGGGQEAARELATGEDLSPEKIAIAGGVGAVENRPTKLGGKLFEVGGNTAIRGMQAGVRGAAGVRDYFRKPGTGARQEFDAESTARPVAPDSRQLPAPEAPPPANDPYAALIPSKAPGGDVAPPPAATLPAIGAAPAEGSAGKGDAGTAGDVPAPIATALPREPQALQDGESYVRTPAGSKIRTKLEVVDAASLNKASGALQNRDRSRDTTALQVQDIVGKFDPELLGNDPSSDRGAPIVAPDHTVLSGNGRMLALNQVYDAHPDKAAAYRAFIEAQGHSTEGMERPVLIRRVTQDMTPDEARQFVIESNKDNKLELSPVERARSDADAVTPEMLTKYAGGDLNSGANSGFVQAFTKSLTAGELGNVIGSDRRLTTAGTERIENAVVAKAYDHPKLLEKLMESPHNEIRAITSSLANVAPSWAKMRAAASAGELGGHYDITHDLADAAMRVAEARRAGTKPADILTQIDAFDRPSPVAEKLIEAFYSPGMKRPASVKSVTQFLHDYIDEANGQKPSVDMFGESSPGKTPADILNELLRQRDGGDAPLLDRSEGHGHFERTAGDHSAAPDGQARRHVGGAEEAPAGSTVARAADEEHAPRGQQPAATGSAAGAGASGGADGADRSGAAERGPAERGAVGADAEGDNGSGAERDALDRHLKENGDGNSGPDISQSGRPGSDRSGGDAADHPSSGDDRSDAGDARRRERGGPPPATEGPRDAGARQPSGSDRGHRADVPELGGGEAASRRLRGQHELDDRDGRMAANEAANDRLDLRGAARETADLRGQGAGRRRDTDANANTDAAANRSGQLLDDSLNALEGEEDGSAYPQPAASPEGAYKPSFDEASHTNRASIFSAAAEAVGLDAERFRLLPAPRQVHLLQRAMKDRFGITVTVDKGMQERFAIDQMLDAFQNAQGMAHVFNLPSRAISLDGKLSLHLKKNANFLGSYSPGEEQITLPKRSNSFAHEWGHALDYHLLGMTDGDGRGLSGAVRSDGSKVANDELPTDVRSAFVDLLNAMFFDHAAAAHKIMQLEKSIAASKDGTKRKGELQAQLKRLKDGSSKARDISTAFHKNAKAYDGPGGDYWSSPTEMFARAFEAYTSYTVESWGLSTEFIGKGDANYLDGAGERFEKTFPKGEERAAIFAAFDNLFGQISAHEVAAPGPAAERPSGPVNRITDLDKQPKVQRERGIINREVAEIRRAVNRARREKAGRMDDPKGTIEKAADLNAAVFGSMAGNLRMIQGRSGSPTLQKLIDMLTKQDGKGDRTVTRTFHEDVHIRSKQAINRLANILKANKADDLDAEGAMTLRDLLTGSRSDGPDNLVKAAAAIRQLLDHEFYENHKAGINLGYTRNGYLARVLDLPRVWHDQEGFTTQAAKVYEIIFDKAFGTPEGVANSEELLPRFLKLARSLAKKGHDIDTGPVKSILKQMKKIDGAIAAAKSKGEDYGNLQGKFADLQEQLVEAMGELWDQVRPAYAKDRAEAWLGRINLTAGDEHNAAAPDSKYTKHRSLPAEADKLMEKYYLQDPVEAVTNYLTQSARRTAYAKRFGHDGAKRKAMFEAMAKEGVSPDDQRTVARILDTVTGRRRSELPKSVQDALGVINAAGVMALLPRATLSSLAEPFTAGLVTGNAMDGFSIVGKMVGSGLGSPSGKVRYELARAMGIVSDLASDGIMEARYGQTWADETRSDRFVAKMFRVTGLTPLTRAQKAAGVGLAHAFLDNLAQHVTSGSGGQKANAIALMRELGIRDPDAFSKQLLAMGRLPTVEELDSAFGEDYTTAQLRFSTMVIQEPTAVDRPELAQNPVGRVMYGITGFSYGYWRNILKRNGILLKEMAKRDGPRAALYAAGLAAAAATAYLMQLTVSVIRERLLNPKRWHDLQQQGTLNSTMAELAFTRTFSFGGADPVIQSYTGLKYQRDLTGLFVGAGPNFFLSNGQKVLQLSVANSRKTNTAEYGALQGVYSNASPFVAMGLARIPGGPMIDMASGIGMAYVTSPAARDSVATAVVGPKNGSLGPDGKKVKSGPTGYDKLLDDTFGKVERKKPSK